MADVTATFGAKDVGVAATIQRLENRLKGFQASMTGVSASAKNMQNSFSNLGRSVIGLAATYVGVTQAINAFNKALGMADRLDDLSKITGASAGDLAVLERAFENTGVGGDKMLPMLSKMTKFVEDLGKGNKEAVATADMLGVSFDRLNRLAPIDRFNLLMRAVMGLTSENKQNSASMDVFGARAGLVATLLAKDFNGALGESRAQLGSLVRILNESGHTLGDLNDILKNSVFNKPTEFAIGFLAGVKGAKEFAKSLSDIDAAGFGEKIGKIFAGIAKDPGSGFVLFGEMLLLGVMRAGNALANASLFAAEVYKKALSNPTTFKGLIDGLLAGFQMIFNFAASMVQKIVRTFVEGLAGIASMLPGIGPALARSIAEPIAGIENLQKETAKQGEDLRKRMRESLGSTAGDILETARTMPRPDVDFLDAARQADGVQALADRLSQLVPATGADKARAALSPEDSEQRRREIHTAYNEQLEAIRNSSRSHNEFSERLRTLNQQMNEALRDLHSRSPGNAVNQNAMPQAEREEMARQASASSQPTAKQEEVASEPTLKRAVELLAELNTKLPQPVLV